MTINDIVMAMTFLSSAVALYFSTRKQKHDEANLDADTIGKLYDLIDRQEKRYQDLKTELTSEINKLREEIEVLREEKQDRENTIETLRRENAELTAQVQDYNAQVQDW